jgi:prepilin-type N-terminal cleavage/methylation domain-containing protein
MRRLEHNFRARSCVGFTLAEVTIALAVGSIVALCSISTMVEGMHLFKCTSTEMIARDAGSRAIRKMSTDIQQALTAQVFSTYQDMTGAAGQYGSCILLQTPSGGSVAYYLYTSSAYPNSGAIYYHSNAATAPNPATDKLLVSSVQGLEFRSDPHGSIRAGFKIGIFGYPSLVVGGQEADIVRFSTSNLPRN